VSHFARLAAPLLAAALAACAVATQPAGPQAAAPQPPVFDGFVLITADGTRLPLRVWLPQGEVRAVVVGLHGFNDYSAMYQNYGPGAWLAERGVALYAYDQRGFGAGPYTGVWPGADRLVSDLKDAVALVRERHPDVPVHALGHSMGGAVVLAALTDAEPLQVEGAILVAPAVWGRRTMPPLQPLALWVAYNLMPGARFTGESVGVQASDNIEMLRGLGADPLFIKETRVDAMKGVVDLMDRALAAAPNLNGPVLLLYGLKDEVIPPNATRVFLRDLAPDPTIRIAIYADGWHMLLRDLQREVVWRDIDTWLEDPAAPLPSGADTVDPIVLTQALEDRPQ